MGRPHPGTERPLHGPLQSFNLDSEVARLRREEEWQQSRREYQEQRNAITLRKGGGLNLVLFVMKAGDRLDEHFAPGPITLIAPRMAKPLLLGPTLVGREAPVWTACFSLWSLRSLASSEG
jgi:hypothetical protein